MKILFVSYLYYPDITGGAARSVQFLAESLAQNGHEVHVARFSQQPQVPYVHNGVTVHCLRLRNIYWPYDGQKRPGWKRLIWHALDIFNPFAAFDFARLLRKLKPDVVNTSIIAGFSTSIFYVTRTMGIKTIHTMRDYYLMCPQVAMFRNGCNCDEICGSCKPFAAARARALKNVDMMLGNSEYVVRRHRIHGMIPRSIPAYSQLNMNLSPIVKNPRVLGKTIRFGFIGKISDTKGLEPMLKAATELKGKNWTLLVAGKGDESYVNKLKSTYQHPQITFAGWMDSTEFYKQIDILLCPSIYEDPLPRVVLEAYAQGLPVIVSNRGGLPEMVEEGKTGFSVDPYDVAQIVTAMDAFMKPGVKYEAMSRSAIITAGRYTQEAVLRQYLQRLSEVTA